MLIFRIKKWKHHIFFYISWLKWKEEVGLPVELDEDTPRIAAAVVSVLFVECLWMLGGPQGPRLTEETPEEVEECVREILKSVILTLNFLYSPVTAERIQRCTSVICISYKCFCLLHYAQHRRQWSALSVACIKRHRYCVTRPPLHGCHTVSGFRH